MRKLGFCLAVLLLFTPVGSVRTQTEDNPAWAVMRKVIENAKENERQKRQHLNYKKRIMITELDNSGRAIKVKKDQLVEILPPRGSEIVREENGRQINKSQDSSVSFEMLIRALSIAFDYELAKSTDSCPTCPVLYKDGKILLVIDFKAKNNLKNSDDDMLNIMYRSAGTMYVDLNSFYVRRFESKLTRVYTRGWIIFKLKRADLELEQEERNESDRIVVLRSMIVTDGYSFFGDNFEKRTWTYTDYKYIP